MIIFGTRGRESEGEEILEKSCPSCQKDLQETYLKNWFTLYFIPVFPFQTVETFFKCNGCSQTYKESIKDHLLSPQERKKLDAEAKESFATTLAVCMNYMARIDGKVDQKEKSEIKKVRDKFPEFSKHVEKALKEYKTKEQVLEKLRSAREKLSADGIMMIIGQTARVLLADGKIDKKEEKLMKEMMVVAGLPANLYDTVLEKVSANLSK